MLFPKRYKATVHLGKGPTLAEMAVVNIELGGLQPFDCKGEATAMAPRWKKWRKSFEYFVVGKGVRDDEQKKALLLHCAGTDVQELYDTLPDPPQAPAAAAAVGDGDAQPAPPVTEYARAMAKLDAYFVAKINVPYE